MSGTGTEVLIHPGFHKTGTTSAQHLCALYENRLAPHLAMLLPRDLKEVAAATLNYSKNRNTLVLMDVAEALIAALAPFAAEPPRRLLISSEALSGLIPGRRDVADYSALDAILPIVIEAVRECLPRARIRVALTTRATEDFLWSLWRHNLAGSPLTEDFDSYRRAYAGLDLAQEAARIAALIAPVPLIPLPLEETARDRLGPAGPLLRETGLSANILALLDPEPPRNAGLTAEQAQALLALNRADLPRPEKRARKKALLKSWDTA